MGTRHLVCAVLNNEFKIAQYGQFDGYPDGAGREVCEFVKKTDMDKFKSCLSKVVSVDDEFLDKLFQKYGKDGWMSMEESNRLQADHPEFHRNTSAQIFDLVMNDTEAVSLAVDFGYDSLFCEYAYVLNMDNETLEFYKGFQKAPHSCGRWAKNEPNEHGYYPVNGYYPVKLDETISFDEAMDLFKLPLHLGEHEGMEVVVNVGRFGPYVKWGEQFISIPKGEEPTDVDLKRAVEIINAKQVEDAPIGFYDEKPITKGKGRFGPFIKWNNLFINIPRAYNFDSLSQQDCNELIEKKIEKEANRYIQQWPEENISIENGRWGPFIKFGKKMLKIKGQGANGKYTAEELAVIDLESIKKMIVDQDPKAFDKKTPTKKKAATKKAAPKKSAKKK